jgi:hypothetical protein
VKDDAEFIAERIGGFQDTRKQAEPQSERERAFAPGREQKGSSA